MASKLPALSYSSTFTIQVGNNALEAVFQCQLHGARAMRVYGMQKGASSEAIRTPRKVSAGGIVRSSVATYSVAAGVAQIRVVNAELSMIEDVERLRAKFEFAFANGKMLQQRHIEV